MNVNRERYLFLVVAMFACHRQQESPRGPGAAESTSNATGSDAPKPIMVRTIAPEEHDERPLDAASPEIPAPAACASLPAPAVPVDSAKPPQATAVPTWGALARRCERFKSDPHDDCGTPSFRRKLCVAFAREYKPPVADEAIECLEQTPDCMSYCSLRACAKAPLEKVQRQSVPACAAQAAAYAREGSGSEQEMTEMCEQYASGMNAVGRKRFVDCLTDNYGMISFCLWDPTVTPCTERGGNYGF